MILFQFFFMLVFKIILQVTEHYNKANFPILKNIAFQSNKILNSSENNSVFVYWTAILPLMWISDIP